VSDYHLQGEIQLKEAENSWCLQEFSEDGEQVGKDFEPHTGETNFTAINLTVGYTTGVDNFDILSKEIERKNKEKEHIFGLLRPSITRRLGSDTYSLFRTERKIERYEFRIVRLDGDRDHHVCLLSGYPSFTTSIDLGGGIEDDCLRLDIGLLPASYDKLIVEIKNNRVEELSISLNVVPGFYAGYRYLGPNDIKVLLYDKSHEVHQVVIPDDCEIDPPRLGEVKEFDITITQNRSFSPMQSILETEESIDQEDSDPETDVLEQVITRLNRIEMVLTKLQNPMKVIIAVLALICLILLWK